MHTFFPVSPDEGWLFHTRQHEMQKGQTETARLDPSDEGTRFRAPSGLAHGRGIRRPATHPGTRSPAGSIPARLLSIARAVGRPSFPSPPASHALGALTNRVGGTKKEASPARKNHDPDTQRASLDPLPQSPKYRSHTPYTRGSQISPARDR